MACPALEQEIGRDKMEVWKLEMSPGMGAQLMLVEPCEPTHCSLGSNGKKWKADSCLATQLLWRLRSDSWVPTYLLSPLSSPWDQVRMCGIREPGYPAKENLSRSVWETK